MNLFISNTADKPIYEQICSQIKEMIMNGELKGGDSLPSMRSLARDLRISVITTKRAYEELEREGFIYTMVGKGSFVAEANRELMREERLKKIEGKMTEIVDLARGCGIQKKELSELLDLLYEED